MAFIARANCVAIATMTLMTTANEWIDAYAEGLGVDAPSQEEIDHILALAGTAAHASERTAAPVACWLAAKAGLEAEEALASAQRIVVPGSDTTTGEA
jgi:hypothetical protein